LAELEQQEGGQGSSRSCASRTGNGYFSFQLGNRGWNPKCVHVIARGDEQKTFHGDRNRII
jgi:hypothetical protein